MNKNRIWRMVSALTIVGIVASQIPSRSAVSLAADGYPESNAILQQSLVSVIAGGFVVGGVYSVIRPGASGGSVFGGGSAGGDGLLGGNKPIYDLTKSKDEFSSIARIISNAGEIEMYRTDEFTVFWPTNDALTTALGQNRVDQLEQAANKSEAITFLERITVKGKYSLRRLTDLANAGSTLKTVSGDSIELTITNGKLTANGVEILGSEYPTSNGWVLVANGLVVTEQS